MSPVIPPFASWVPLGILTVLSCYAAAAWLRDKRRRTEETP